MGISPIKISRHHGDTVTRVEIVTTRERIVPDIPNPDPSNFRIIQIRNNLKFDHCALMVRYPDATSFEGLKVMVVKASLYEVNHLTVLDPHFNQNGLVVARFAPTDEGWEDANWYLENRT